MSEMLAYILTLVLMFALAALGILFTWFYWWRWRPLKHDMARLEALEADRVRQRTAHAAPPVAPSLPSGDRAPVEPLTQDDYVALLEADRGQQRAFTLEGPERTWHYCRQCHHRAIVLEIAHPIWDGPFDGAGSGIVDTRLVPLCVTCDRRLDLRLLGGVVPGAELVTENAFTATTAGRPIRLPWLDRLPVRLHPELFDRPAFHQLSVRVERWRAPAAPPAAEPSE